MSNLPIRTPTPGGGLNIPAGSLGLSPVEERRAANRWNTLERVVDQIERWGFKDATTPQIEVPVITAEMLLTPDITKYAAMYSATKDWYNYANKLRVRLAGELLQIENEMNDIAAEIRKSLRAQNSKINAQTLSDSVTTDSHYRALSIRAQEVTQLKAETAVQVEELETNMKLVSRNIELRKEEMGAGRQESNMPGRTRQGPWTGRHGE